MRLDSNFEAFNPDGLLDARNEKIGEADEDEGLIIKAPVSETVPLLVILKTNGEWDVIGETPETSTNASGYNAARNGFRPDKMFVCKICIKKDHFQVIKS